MPTNQQAVAGLRRLISEAYDLCGRARNLPLKEAHQIALRSRHGQITADAKVSFAFQTMLARDIRGWLERAELAVRASRGEVAADAPALLDQLRHLIDTANMALLRRSESQRSWTAFYAAADRSEQSASTSQH